MFKIRIKLNWVFLIFLMVLWGTVKAKEVQKLKPEWVKTFGGIKDDRAYALQILPDGNIIIAGGTFSYGGMDVYVIKIDENGNKIWEKTFGGSENDKALALQVFPDGNIIITGWTKSYGAGGRDVLVLKAKIGYIYVLHNNAPLLSPTGKVRRQTHKIKA